MSTIPLPPSQRDFEIHRQVLIESISTRRVAEHFEISQTRVRQIVAQVSKWLADQLPPMTEADQAKEQRLAIHLAAARLQHQIEQLQSVWTGTVDPKYLRQQTRAIIALARLGITPGSLDALAANVVPSFHEGQEAQTTSESPPTPHQEHPGEQADLGCTPSHPLSPSPSLPLTSSLQSDIRHSTFDFRPCTSPPPSEDCSPKSASLDSTAKEPAAPSSPTPSPPINSAFPPEPEDGVIVGLTIMEQRLLTLLEESQPTDAERRQSLSTTLDNVRRQRANYILQLNPNSPVIPPMASPSPQHSPLIPVS